MKSNNEIMYFSSIGHHIISHLVKFEIQILLVRGGMKRRNLSWGLIRLTEIVMRSNLRLNIVQRVK